MGAMLSNPDLDSQRIKEKFLESGRVAEDIIETLERLSL